MALSNDATNFVLRALQSLMATQGQCFTAFDVTKAARSLTDERIDHNDVRQVLHNLYDQGFLAGYTRMNHNIVTVPGGSNTWAQLFVPAGATPHTYDPSQVVMSKVATANATCGASCDEDEDEDEDESDEDKSDEDGCDSECDDTCDAGSPPLPVDKTDFHKHFPPSLYGVTGLLVHTSVNNDPAPTSPAWDRQAVESRISASPVSITPPVNLGGQVVLTGGTSASTPAAPQNKPVANPVQQDNYLNTWNKPETRAEAVEEGLLSKLKNTISSKLKDLLS